MLLDALLVLSLAGSGLVAGLFFAFSVAVMPALAREPGGAATAVMQRINAVIVRPVFLLVFVGTAVVSAAAVVVALVDGGAAGRAGAGAPVAAWALAGTVLYLVTSVGLTSGYHVPRNDRLAAADPGTPDGASTWEVYQREWTRWNHVRAAGCLLATVALAVALAVS